MILKVSESHSSSNNCSLEIGLMNCKSFLGPIVSSQFLICNSCNDLQPMIYFTDPNVNLILFVLICERIYGSEAANLFPGSNFKT